MAVLKFAAYSYFLVASGLFLTRCHAFGGKCGSFNSEIMGCYGCYSSTGCRNLTMSCDNGKRIMLYGAWYIFELQTSQCIEDVPCDYHDVNRCCSPKKMQFLNSQSYKGIHFGTNRYASLVKDCQGETFCTTKVPSTQSNISDRFRNTSGGVGVYYRCADDHQRVNICQKKTVSGKIVYADYNSEDKAHVDFKCSCVLESTKDDNNVTMNTAWSLSGCNSSCSLAIKTKNGLHVLNFDKNYNNYHKVATLSLNSNDRAVIEFSLATEDNQQVWWTSLQAAHELKLTCDSNVEITEEQTDTNLVHLCENDTITADKITAVLNPRNLPNKRTECMCTLKTTVQRNQAEFSASWLFFGCQPHSVISIRSLFGHHTLKMDKPVTLHKTFENIPLVLAVAEVVSLSLKPDCLPQYLMLVINAKNNLTMSCQDSSLDEMDSSVIQTSTQMKDSSVIQTSTQMKDSSVIQTSTQMKEIQTSKPTKVPGINTSLRYATKYKSDPTGFLVALCILLVTVVALSSTLVFFCCRRKLWKRNPTSECKTNKRSVMGTTSNETYTPFDGVDDVQLNTPQESLHSLDYSQIHVQEMQPQYSSFAVPVPEQVMNNEQTNLIDLK